jgi:hypothetical protein
LAHVPLMLRSPGMSTLVRSTLSNVSLVHAACDLSAAVLLGQPYTRF